MMRRRLVGAAALVALLTGCGMPLDDAPRAIRATTTTVASDAPVTEEPEDGSSAFLFFIADNQLINLDQDIVSLAPADALGSLFVGVPAGASQDVVSQIPPGTRLLGVEQSGSMLEVDVSKEFDNLVGTGRTQATAQIVMTATDLLGIDQVALSIDGQPTQVFSPTRGDTDRVAACDYVGLLPTEDLLANWPLDRKSERHLITRRNMLVAQCPQATTGG